MCDFINARVDEVNHASREASVEMVVLSFRRKVDNAGGWANCRRGSSYALNSSVSSFSAGAFLRTGREVHDLHSGV